MLKNELDEMNEITKTTRRAYDALSFLSPIARGLAMEAIENHLFERRAKAKTEREALKTPASNPSTHIGKNKTPIKEIPMVVVVCGDLPELGAKMLAATLSASTEQISEANRGNPVCLLSISGGIRKDDAVKIRELIDGSIIAD